MHAGKQFVIGLLESLAMWRLMQEASTWDVISDPKHTPNRLIYSRVNPVKLSSHLVEQAEGAAPSSIAVQLLQEPSALVHVRDRSKSYAFT